MPLPWEQSGWPDEAKAAPPIMRLADRAVATATRLVVLETTVPLLVHRTPSGDELRSRWYGGDR
jgi:hypothetical protein